MWLDCRPSSSSCSITLRFLVEDENKVVVGVGVFVAIVVLRRMLVVVGTAEVVVEVVGVKEERFFDCRSNCFNKTWSCSSCCCHHFLADDSRIRRRPGIGLVAAFNSNPNGQTSWFRSWCPLRTLAEADLGVEKDELACKRSTNSHSAVAVRLNVKICMLIEEDVGDVKEIDLNEFQKLTKIEWNSMETIEMWKGSETRLKNVQSTSTLVWSIRLKSVYLQMIWD